MKEIILVVVPGWFKRCATRLEGMQLFEEALLSNIGVPSKLRGHKDVERFLSGASNHLTSKGFGGRGAIQLIAITEDK